MNDKHQHNFQQAQQEQQEQQLLFYNAILHDDTKYIQKFLNGTLSSLYLQFKYPIEKDYLPNKDCHVTPIIIAILSNKLSILKLLIQHQRNSQDSEDSVPPFATSIYQEHGIPLFFYAIETCCIEMMQFTLQLSTTATNSIDTITSNKGHNPLQFSVLYLQVHHIQHLLQFQQCDISIKDRNDSNLLHLASSCTSIELIDYIISLNELFLDETNGEDFLPILSACDSGNTIIVEHLINHHNVNPFVMDYIDWNMMHYAAYRKNPEMVQVVANAFEKCENLPENILFHGKQVDESTINSLPNGYRRIAGEWVGLVQPIHLAINQAHLPSIRQLVRSKANITITNNTIIDVHQCSSLLHSTYLSGIDNGYCVFKYLLSDECLQDWNSEELKFNDGATIQIYGQKDPIQAQINIPLGDLLEPSLLLQVASQQEFNLVQLLIERNADINYCNNINQKLLHVSATNIRYSIIGDLLEHYTPQLQAQLYQYDNYGYLPIHYAIFTAKASSPKQVNDHINDNDTYNLLNLDLQSLIQYDPLLLVQQTKSDRTTLHVAVRTIDESPITLMGLIESIVSNIDFVFSLE